MFARRSLSLTLALVASAGLTACSSPSYEMEIAPSLRNCSSSVRDWLCMSATAADGGSHTLYSGIEGFEFEWCQRARLLVHEEHVSNPPADGSSIRYVLDEVIERVEVPGYEMTLTIFDSRLRDDGEIQGFGFAPRCDPADATLCDELRAALEDPSVDRAEATFRCEEGEAVPLLIDVVEPAE